MDDRDWLAGQFERYRPRPMAVAARMLSSRTEADDAGQEAWIRFNRSNLSEIDNLGAWLTTVVSRVCLNTLQSRRRQATDSFDAELVESDLVDENPESEALIADSVGLALLIVLDSLTPTERVAFVLHDMFAVPFEDIAPIVGRNATATRQLASRARRRVQQTDVDHAPDRLRQSRLVEAFLAAARHGDFAALVEVLDPDAVMRGDAAAVAIGGPEVAYGAEAVAKFSLRARGASPALIGGVPAAVWMPNGRLRVALLFIFSDDRIAGIEAVAEPRRLAALDLVVAEEDTS